MIGPLFRSFLYSTPGEVVFTILLTSLAYELAMRPERVVEDPQDWLLVAAFVVVAAIAIFRTAALLRNGHYLKGPKFILYKIQKGCLLVSALLFLAAVTLHLLR